MANFLYEQLASRLEEQIRTGLLKAGDKLVSVRGLSSEHGVSLSTAYQVYSELENRGLIEARPRSGYYVKVRRRPVTAPMATMLQVKEAGTGNVQDMISAVYRQIPHKEIVLLSRAAPPEELLPVAKLNKSMLETLRKSPTGNGHYEQLEGFEGLRKQVAKNAFNWGGQISADDVVTTQGCMEALVFCLRALTKRGDTVAIESPAYFGIFNIMLNLDLNVLEVPVAPEGGPDLDYLQKAIENVQVKACLFVTNFSNPSGGLMPEVNKQRLVKLLRNRQIPLIEDDIYGDLYFNGKRPLNCKAFDTEGLVLLCSSVSKSLAPGYRVGWCIPGRFKEQVLNVKMMHTISSATPTQAAIAHFFETGRYDLHLRKLRKTLYLQ